MHATSNAKEMGWLRANSNADATVPAEEILKPVSAVNQEDEAHSDPALSAIIIFHGSTCSEWPFIDRVHFVDDIMPLGCADRSRYM